MQQNQIIPEYSFPYIKTVVNDYSIINKAELTTNANSTITQAYAVVSQKGIDNRWVKVVDRSEAIRLFGNSKYKLYGQPLMQAINVLNKRGAAVWFMRVLPENATYANAFVSAYYKADSSSTNVLDRKFRIKLVSSSKEGITNKDDFTSALNASNLFVADSDGYAQVPLFGARYVGRGKAGNNYSCRINQNIPYEKEYGIKIFNFEMMCNDASLVKETSMQGSIVTSDKYIDETTSSRNLTLNIADSISDVEEGYCPIIIEPNEETIETLYDAYVLFINDLHEDAIEEYESKLESYDVPSDMLDGIIPVTDEYEDKYNELKEISALIDATSKIPDLDAFDPLFGKYVADSYSSLPAIYFPEKLTDDIDTTDPDFVSSNYTNTDIVNFSSLKGLVLENGNDGYFESPRQTIDESGSVTTWTLDQEIEKAYTNAFNGTYDRRILSPRRIPITVFFDANYPYSVKRVIYNTFKERNDCFVSLDAGIINSFSLNNLVVLSNKYGIFDDKMVSIESQNYAVREYSTKKKVRVTTNYYLSAAFIDHVNNYSIEIPFVRDYCTLSGHIKDSLNPMVEEYDIDVKEALTTYRLNFFECRGENIFKRAIQNTSQKSTSDFLEINNALVYFELKRQIEDDLQSQIYNFADNNTRESFVLFENAKYANIKGSLVENISFNFILTDYEFEHSILHFLCAITFRGLTKQVIFEIDINKRTRVVEEE